MSEFYIIGQNRLVANINDASVVASISHGGTTYVYWRYSTVNGVDDNASQIRMSSSTDLKIWTTPTTVWTQSTRDVSPITVIHNGTQFLMLVSERNITSGSVTTRLLTSTNATSWSSLGTVTWSEFWAHPTDLHYDGSKYYLAATTRVTFDGPMITTVMTSTNLTAWTSLGYANQVTAKDNVWAKIAISGSTIHVIHREGTFFTKDVDDRILYTSYNGEYWQLVDIVATKATGNPDIIPLDEGYAIIYQDQQIEGGHGIWSWIFYDLAKDEFIRRGTFSQGFEYGMGGNAEALASGFAVVYSTRNNDQSSAGKLYYRVFSSTEDDPKPVMNPRFSKRDQPQINDELENFAVEISYGEMWVSLTDHRRFYVSAEEFGEKQQTRRRISASSPFYNGSYLIHSTLENVQETVTVVVLGSSQNQVSENLLFLEELISQPSYRLRMRVQDHQETWVCQPADYNISRGHIMLHNSRAQMRLQIPRLPDVSYEVVW